MTNKTTQVAFIKGYSSELHLWNKCSIVFEYAVNYSYEFLSNMTLCYIKVFTFGSFFCHIGGKCGISH